MAYLGEVKPYMQVDQPVYGGAAHVRVDFCLHGGEVAVGHVVSGLHGVCNGSEV